MSENGQKIAENDIYAIELPPWPCRTCSSRPRPRTAAAAAPERKKREMHLLTCGDK